MGNPVSPKSERVALIGCGAASEILYASALDMLSAERVIEVTALVDPNPERTLAIGKKFPLARHHLNVDSMLAETAPDLAIIVNGTLGLALGLVAAALWPVGLIVYPQAMHSLTARGRQRARYYMITEAE